MRNRNNSIAFTLAEVLITLGIIGVIAALTIPTLMQKTQEAEAVSKVKKVYALISEAVAQWADENHCTDDISECFAGTNVYAFDCRVVLKDLEPHLKIVDTRYQDEGAKLDTIDWIADTSYNLDGTPNNYNWQGVSKIHSSDIYSCNYLLADGTTLMFSMGSPAIGTIFFDVNGKKKPNRVGKDQFPVGLGAYNNPAFNKLVSPYPSPYDGASYSGGLCTSNDGNVCNPDDGKSPTAYVLKYGKLPDLGSAGFPALP